MPREDVPENRGSAASALLRHPYAVLAAVLVALALFFCCYPHVELSVVTRVGSVGVTGERPTENARSTVRRNDDEERVRGSPLQRDDEDANLQCELMPVRTL